MSTAIREARLRTLHRERLAAYTVCAEAIVTDDGTRSAGDIAAEVTTLTRHLATPEVLVEQVEVGGGRSYPVVVGPGVRDRLPGFGARWGEAGGRGHPGGNRR